MKKDKATAKEKNRMKKLAVFINLLFFKNTGYKQGKPGMSKVYWAPLSAITTQPEPPATGTTVGETSTASGSWTFETDAAWDPNGFIDVCNDLLEGAQMQYVPDGALNSMAEKSKLMYRVIGLDPELMERARQMQGVPGVFAVRTPDCTSTEYWIIGCTCGAAYAKPNFDSDKLGGSKGKGWDYEINANCAPYKWSGTLPLREPA